MKLYNIPEGSLESVTKKAIKLFFKDHNIWYQMPQPGAMGKSSGTSDFVALHKGLMICVEAKRNSKSAKVSNLQKIFIDTINANGGLAVVVGCEADLTSLEAELYSRGIL